MLLSANSLAPIQDLDCRYCGALAGELCCGPRGHLFLKGGLIECHQPRRRKHMERRGRLDMVRLIEKQGSITVADIIVRNLLEE